jgi:hypothetical protein
MCGHWDIAVQREAITFSADEFHCLMGSFTAPEVLRHSLSLIVLALELAESIRYRVCKDFL